MEINEVIKSMEPEMIQMLQELIQIPSVKDKAEPGAPFGKEVKRCLDKTLEYCEKFGYNTKDIDGYAGHAEYGSGEELLGILSHLDVVPVGSGWTKDPFGAEIENGIMYGRGSMDNKGPTVAVLFALQALIKMGVPINKRIRFIFGCDEESGWECVKYYFKKEEVPSIAFTPDGMFPIINREKGILRMRLSQSVDSKNKDLKNIFHIVSVEGGDRANMVPDLSQAVIEWELSSQKEAEKILEDVTIPDVSVVEIEPGRARVQATGISSHACVPEQGKNAVLSLVRYLNQLPVQQTDMAAFLTFLEERLDDQNSGKGLGIDYTDETSGSLTLNLGVIRISEKKAAVDLDVRHPVTMEKNDIMDRLDVVLKDTEIVAEIIDYKKPLFVPADHKLVKTLGKAYEKVTGEPATLLAIGGGTYARALDNTVAFGSLFPGRPNVGHTADEHFFLEDLTRMTEIYAEAIKELVKNKE